MLNAKSILQLRGGRLISLWEMVRFIAAELVNLLNGISEESDHAWICSQDNDEEQPGPTANVSQADRRRVVELLKEVAAHCEAIGLVKVKGRISPFKAQLENANEDCVYPIISDELGKLRHVIAEEIHERTFAFISQAKASFFEQEVLFGDVVNSKFPTARNHIKNAGNCIAADLHTAAVYHLMCVAEVGLRAMAKQLHVKVLKQKGLPAPLELGTWEQVIRALENKESGRFPKSQKGLQESDFYKGVFLETEPSKTFGEIKSCIPALNTESMRPLPLFSMSKPLCNAYRKEFPSGDR